jgi:hypothetical protein
MSRSYAPIVRQTKPPEPVLGAIGLAGELAAFNYLKHKHRTRFSDRCWVSENRGTAFPDPGDPTLGYDFRVNTARVEWLYEVKAARIESGFW